MGRRGGNGDRAGRAVRVLEVDPDLGSDLDAESFEAAARELAVPATTLDWRRMRGPWGPSDPQGHLGLLVLDGLLLREVELLGTFSAEILGQGDLLRPWDVDGGYRLPVRAEANWTLLESVEVAVLGPEFLRRTAAWPDVLARLTGRTVERARALALHDAITNLKHVETRLLVQFWHLAERWGRVGPESIAVPVPLTHEMLARLVGATRPSVTTALGRLAARGLLTRDEAGVWRLDPTAAKELEARPALTRAGRRW
jgi:CRP/FNR family cyclic AMP-dependent transcriptional regulator